MVNRPDARVANIERKVDTLSDQLADLTFFIKNERRNDHGSNSGHKSGAGNGADGDHVCSFCKEPCCAAARCLDNADRHEICENCGKKSHRKSRCWSKKDKRQAEAVSAVDEDDGNGVDAISLDD